MFNHVINKNKKIILFSHVLKFINFLFLKIPFLVIPLDIQISLESLTLIKKIVKYT